MPQHGNNIWIAHVKVIEFSQGRGKHHGPRDFLWLALKGHLNNTEREVPSF